MGIVKIGKISMRTCIQILAKLGNHYHQKGIQVVDKESFLRMRTKLKSWFGRRIPIYKGHPDDSINPFCKIGLKSKELGFVCDLILADDTILIVSQYNESAYEEVKNGLLLSPRWEMQALGNGRFRPIRLISVGLTSRPNIRESGTPFKIWEI